MDKAIGKKFDDLMEEVSQVRVSVGKIEEHLKGINGRIGKHELAIEDNSKFRYKLTGALLLVGGISTFLSIMAITKSMGLI